MSALLSSTDDNNDSTKTYNFKQNTTIPSYLIAIAAGNLAGREIGPRSTVWCEPEVVEQAAWEFDVSKFKRSGPSLCKIRDLMCCQLYRTLKDSLLLVKASWLLMNGDATISWSCPLLSPTVAWRYVCTWLSQMIESVSGPIRFGFELMNNELTFMVKRIPVWLSLHLLSWPVKYYPYTVFGVFILICWFDLQATRVLLM